MKIYRYPEKEDWERIIKRPEFDQSSLFESVEKILQSVKTEGDLAVKRFTQQFDKVVRDEIYVTESEKEMAISSLPEEIRSSIELAAKNIRRFHQVQLVAPQVIETMPGIICWRKSVAIEKVGFYIPGGTAPLFSTILMLGIPASIAGCKEIILCTPPGRDGKIHPAILYTAGICGIKNVFAVGGVQAIGAMAYGTATIPKVDKIFGPGNQYVTAAKQLIQQKGVAIDMPAGPSEVCVLADEEASPAFIAADLISQAEHGADSQVLLVSTSDDLVTLTIAELEKQLSAIPRREFAAKALQYSNAVVTRNISDALDIVNAYAPEHLIIMSKNDEELAEKIISAGSVFLGSFSPESVGDYASGTNHTLPTNGYAKAYSGVSVDSFVKKITYQKLTREGLHAIGPAVITMAECEGLTGHAEAVRVRLATIGEK
ncbi:histidinol dehydrogenase [Pollutibacter soli]|uniref:histidinol dehydrogenase n=1 Tax=Pollutibacter soli TaxID=3034157 RepID=UPI003013800F